MRKKEEEIERKSKLHFAEEKQSAAADNNKDGDEKITNLKPKDNPYARKEVSYVCETGDELSGVVGGIFRRIREGRELGESHGRSAELRLGELLIYHMILCCVSFFNYSTYYILTSYIFVSTTYLLSLSLQATHP